MAKTRKAATPAAKTKHRFDAKRKGTPAARGSRKSAGRTAPKGATARPRKKLPVQGQLPGTEQVRDRVLDVATHGLAECRATAATVTKDEKDYKAKALWRMIDKGYDSYTSNGIRLDRVKGADKLSVHVTEEEVHTVDVGGASEAASGDETNTPAFGGVE